MSGDRGHDGHTIRCRMNDRGRVAASRRDASGGAKDVWLLAVDLSGTRGLLVLEGYRFFGHREVRSGEHTSRLFVEAEELMRRAGVVPRGLGLIGVAVGPGSFTGVRTAVMAAKTLAEVLHLPLVTVDSLAVLAAGVRDARWVFVAVDARRGEVYHALFPLSEEEEGALPADAEWMGVDTPAEAGAALRRWMEDTGERPALVGTGIEVYPEIWPGELRRWPSDRPDPRALAGLCRRAFRRGETVDPLRLSPLYLRKPDIGERGKCGREEA